MKLIEHIVTIGEVKLLTKEGEAIHESRSDETRENDSKVDHLSRRDNY